MADFAAPVNVTDDVGTNFITLELIPEDAPSYGHIVIRDSGGDTVLELGTRLILNSGTGQLRISLEGSTADAYLGGNGVDGDIYLLNSAGTTRIHLDATTGEVFLRSAGGENRIHLDSDGGNIWLGGNDRDGDLVLFPASVTDIHATEQATIWLNADTSNVFLRNAASEDRIQLDGRDGNLHLRSAAGERRIHLDSDRGNIWLGGNNADGDLVVFPRDATDINDESQATIWLDGDAGDIILQNADCAEELDVLESEEIEPATVVVIHGDGKLRPCEEPYDKRVAGVVSGGNGSNPGIILGRSPAQGKRLPIALNGRVYCKVDAQFSPIEIGDLLTTSPSSGHAMKAEDPTKAFGAVIGKALRPLEQGRDLIPILVALQ